MAKFARYFGRSPERLGLEDVRTFQVHLVANGISWPALNQRVCALRFFYGVTLGHADIPERIAYARSPTGAPWADIPERYGPHTTCVNRFNRWRKAGVWDRLLNAVSKAYDGDIQMIDSSSIRVHQHAAAQKKTTQVSLCEIP